MNNFHVFLYSVPYFPESEDHSFGGMNDYYDSYSNLSDAVRAAEETIAREYVYNRETWESTIAVDMNGKLTEILYSIFQPYNVQEWNTPVENERIENFVYTLSKRGRYAYPDIVDKGFDV